VNLLDKITGYFSTATGQAGNTTIGELINAVPFSLNEQDTGRIWIDGKQIFQQVFDLEGLNDLTELIAAGVVDTILSSVGYADISGTLKVAMPFNTGAVFVETELVIISGAIRFRRTQAQTAGSFVTLQYTKINP